MWKKLHKTTLFDIREGATGVKDWQPGCLSFGLLMCRREATVQPTAAAGGCQQRVRCVFFFMSCDAAPETVRTRGLDVCDVWRRPRAVVCDANWLWRSGAHRAEEPCYPSAVSPPLPPFHLRCMELVTAVWRWRCSQGLLRTLKKKKKHNKNSVEKLCAINQEGRPNAAMSRRPCGGVPSRQTPPTVAAEEG